MDTAKGCNFILTNGGAMSDYKGYALAASPMLPFIAVPTTAGTGSECQSYAVISRDGSHEKMACGDPKALAKFAILDPELTESMSQPVAILTALDALAHALETAVCTRRNAFSSAFSREAFLRIASSIEPVLRGRASLEDRGEMLLGAAFSGLAIENSMLGAVHASANPLTARFGLVHGKAVAIMLPHVMRFNQEEPEAREIYDHYGELLTRRGYADLPLIDWVEALLGIADLGSLDEAGVNPAAIPELAGDATKQWTGQFNPRAMTEEGFVLLYQQALESLTPSTT
jgi:alcohol dehydrogenase